MVTRAALSALVKGDIDNFIVGSTKGGIEEQEAEGQRWLCDGKTILPKNYHDCTQKDFEKFGIEIVGDYDDLFNLVKFPKGWKIEPGESSYWSCLVNDQGKEIAKVFYKAAFYDKRAKIYLNE